MCFCNFLHFLDSSASISNPGSVLTAPMPRLLAATRCDSHGRHPRRLFRKVAGAWNCLDVRSECVIQSSLREVSPGATLGNVPSIRVPGTPEDWSRASDLGKL